MAEGEPILTASVLEELDGQFGGAEELLDGICEWLPLPTPQDLTDIDLDELSIQIIPDEEDSDAALVQASSVSGGDGV